MKKITLLIMAVLLGTLAFAQTKTALTVKLPNSTLQTTNGEKSGWVGNTSFGGESVFSLSAGQECAFIPKTVDATACTAGHTITQVKFWYTNAQDGYPGNSFTIKIYKGGPTSVNEPITADACGELVYSQNYTGTTPGIQTVTLSTPYAITNDNFWVALCCNEASSVGLGAYDASTLGKYTVQFEYEGTTYWVPVDFRQPEHEEEIFPLCLAVYVDDGAPYEANSDIKAGFMDGDVRPYNDAPATISLAATDPLVLYPYIENLGPDPVVDTVTISVAANGQELLSGPMGFSDEHSLEVEYFMFCYAHDDPNNAGATLHDVTIPADFLDGQNLTGEFDVCLTATYRGTDLNASNNTKCIHIIREGSTPPATTYTITCNPAENGSIEANLTEAAEGTQITITPSPNLGFELATLVYNDGTDHDIFATRSFAMPPANVTVTATFQVTTATQYTIKARVEGEGGTIQPSGAFVYNEGSQSDEFKITANEGYKISSIKISNVERITDILAISDNTDRLAKYTFTNISQNDSIVAAFELLPVAESDIKLVWFTEPDPAADPVTELQIATDEDLNLWPGLVNLGPDPTDNDISITMSINGQSTPAQTLSLTGEQTLLPDGPYMLLFGQNNAPVIGFSASDMDAMHFTQFTICITGEYLGNDPHTDNNNACITVTRVASTGIDEAVAESISVYPNPANGVLNVSNAAGKDISVYNVLGEVVKTVNNAASEQQIDVTGLVNGLYFVKVDNQVVKFNVAR